MDVDTARKRLFEERERLQATLAAAHAMGRGGSVDGTALSHIGEHPAEYASDVADQQTAMALAGTVDVDLHRVDTALERLDKGTYGRCEVCGEPVEDERLQVTPTARTCIEHREEESRLPDVR